MTDPEERLRKIMNFYFGDKYNSLLGNKIKIINGDITDDLLGQSNINNYNEIAQNIDCVIHSAAIVKHYGKIKKQYGNQEKVILKIDLQVQVQEVYGDFYNHLYL